MHKYDTLNNEFQSIKDQKMGKEIDLYRNVECMQSNILHFWNYLENVNQHPHRLSFLDNDNYQWKCDSGHSFSMSIFQMFYYYQFLKMNPCPQCHKKWKEKGLEKPRREKPNLSKPKPGKSFGDLRPDISKTWDVHRNGKYTPYDFSQFSVKRFWWICEHGHSFDCTLANRNKYGCPVCKGWRVAVGFNDLGTQRPDIARMWHPTMNGDLTPYDVTPGADKLIWWQCPIDEEHVWQQQPWSLTAPRRDKVKTHGCPYCSKHRVSDENSLLINRPDVLLKWDYDKNDKDPGEYSVYSNKKVWWICEDGHSWKATIISATYSNAGCPTCWRNKKMSRGERELADFVKTLIDNPQDPGQYQEGNRELLKPLELDIYLPDKNIAIEYNGVHWHSEKIKNGKNVYANYDKWKKCKDLGIQLITIWEDEWLYKQDVVKSMIRHKLHKDESERIFARKTVVEQLTWSDTEEFLNTYHIQGSSRGSIYYGLKYNDEIVAVSVWRKNKDTLYLDRYATSCNVIGGMGKLLKYGKIYALERGCGGIVTFADHCVSDGSLYERLGFKYDGQLRPDYSYVRQDRREHKFNYRKKRFKNDPLLKYKCGLTESQLADLNGFNKIYDCGKTRWKIKL